MNRIIYGLSLVMLMIVLAACGLSGLQGFSDSQAPSVSVDDVPEEPPKEEIENSIEATDAGDIETIISNNFHLLDVVSTDDGNANVYATNRFAVSELADLVSNTLEPEEKSELKDNQQILIYPDHFATFKLSEENDETVLIEIASDQFVRNHYSPNYLNTFFGFMLLNSMLDRNDWSDRRLGQCRNNNCYGGYTTTRSTQRGMSTVRGGGPSSGK
ncbi:DUF4247 domain-containing protein [Aquibacillus halophilus]|uniref:DUF4247 domain-containing protein n=1 Tax=Aquibacillus halophilus TaxID=930132 RepID=A0A6A8DG85_9BACI|nr:DUF4247 domain-containing protein [Aquibacillus halophilus]MRH42859.1 DUF4247 domain-containing protein [Aquibacillus halophilus]